MKRFTLAICSLMLAAVALADSTAAEAPAAAPQAVDPAIETKIRSSLRVLLPGLRPDSVRATPIPDLYELAFGPRIVYITGDGRFLVQGKLVDLETRTEITDERLTELKLAALNAVSEDRMVVFAPERPRHMVTVFTDIDCGFCRRLHAEMDQYHAQGIAIRYLFYPRAGVGSDSYAKAVSVWCADDRKGAMDDAKAGRDVPPKTCENPVEQHYELGQQMRIQGTPALVLADGEVVPGYVPADKLGRALDQRFGGEGD
jgi:thiol:disulfide interchange protein DsbC